MRKPYAHLKFADLVETSKWAGVVSAAITMSDVKDEIDWEWTGTDTSNAQTNIWFLGIADCKSREDHQKLELTSQILKRKAKKCKWAQIRLKHFTPTL